jgi:hypothetical protein
MTKLCWETDSDACAGMRRIATAQGSDSRIAVKVDPQVRSQDGFRHMSRITGPLMCLIFPTTSKPNRR